MIGAFSDRRLVFAEALKLRKRRALMGWTIFLTSGAIILVYSILAILHGANPHHHGPAGGATNFPHAVQLLGGLGGAAAIILGATGGSQDISSGVFRELVVTGRSRVELFFARWRGALLVFAPLLALAFGFAVLGAFVFAGNTPNPSGAAIGHAAAWVAAHTLVSLTIAVGLASVISARIVIGVVLAWNAIVSPLLGQISLLGFSRKGLYTAAANRLDPSITGRDGLIHMSTGTAILVLLVWAALFLALGAWWTQRRDA
jgi:ABC-type transport system involved in multi-copper enzyme maturation permease subunit